MTQELFDLKRRVARSQLSIALDLFLRDQDPIAVHCLACGGAEVIEGVAHTTGSDPFCNLAKEATGLDHQAIKTARNNIWNAFKHLNKKNGQKLRLGDISLIKDFDDEANDVALFCGWFDYMKVAQKLPIEVQVFQLWFLAQHLTDEELDGSEIEEMFPEIKNSNRKVRKQKLRQVIENCRKIDELMKDAKTETTLLQADSP